MQPICRYAHNLELPIVSTFDYAGVRIIFLNYTGQGCGTLTHHVACTTLRGLAEYLVIKNEFNVKIFDIYVNGIIAGGGKILNTPRSSSASALDVGTA